MGATNNSSMEKGFVQLKKCSKCGKEKDLEKDFHAAPSSKDGRKSYCKDCVRDYNAQKKAEKSGKKPNRKRKADEKEKPAENVTAELASNDVVVGTSFPSSVEIDAMEEQNRQDMRLFARVFVAGLKNELVAAMTEQVGGQNEN